MPVRGGRGIAWLYRRTSRPVDATADEPVEIRPGVSVPRFVLAWSASAPAEAEARLDRFPDALQLSGRSVVTVGRGAGYLGIEAARRGAGSVTAIDMAPRLMLLARLHLEEREPDLPVTILGYGEHLGDQRFDVVIASDAFREYGAEPGSRHVEERAREIVALLAADGVLAVASGPSWKAPFGGSGDSRLPWAHLIFPEDVIFSEFRRVRPESRARSFDDIGINRVTLDRLRGAIAATGVEPVRFATNLGRGRALRVTRALTKVPSLGEYFIQNAYDVWRRPG